MWTPVIISVSSVYTHSFPHTLSITGTITITGSAGQEHGLKNRDQILTHTH